ncbi:DegV family protein, partial [Gorillibacterium massiliense]|uniref:DegV family protein n=1 Tax=Gorillibacterium massiliense TaxID=1280390 RepID=UPI000592BCDB
MSSVRIVTDSTSDIPEEIRKRLNIELIPLKVHVGNKTFTDSVTIQPDDFYTLLAESKVMPKTSQPSPVDFVDIYRKLNKEPGTAIISIHLSSAMSGTYQSAVLAKSMLEEEADITIIDSKSASYGIGIRVVKAAEAAMAGKSKEEILDMLDKLDGKFSIFFLVDTLEYLQKGGRIGKASAALGSLLNIKPILSINQAGEVCSVDKVRGHKKAVA